MTLIDWIKFTPGWFAFIATVATWIYKAWTRRHKVAIGPDDDVVREALTTARTLFNEIIDKGGFHSMWFQAEERRDTGQRLLDLAARRDDTKLRGAMTEVADAWSKASDTSPPPRMSISRMGSPESPSARQTRVEDTATRARQVEVARNGVDLVEAALARLNKLERRTFGRS